MVSILDNVFIANRRAEYVVLKTLIVGSRILFTIFFVAFGAFGIFASIGLADIIAFFTGTFILIPLVQRGYIPFPSIQKSVLNDILHFSIGNHIATVLNSAPGLLLPILITNVLIPETAAYFYIAWMIASLLYVIPLSIATSLFAESSYDERTLHLNVGKAIKFISLLTLPTIVMLMLIADKLLFLFGKGYSENATILLWIFALASIPLAINNLFITIRLIEKKVGIVILINAFIAAFTIVGSYLGLEKFGLLSIGIAWMLSQGIVMLAIARRLSFSAIKEVYSS
jgi:O-antigen/teichoic acid export membrane protein